MNTNPEVNDGSVVLIDGLAMRRACMLSALEPWVTSLGLSMVPYTPKDIFNLKAEGAVRLVLINMGGASLGEADQHELMLAVKASCVSPCAIISDRSDADDAIAAAELGFQAFLPAVLPLDIVKQALIFIMNGGTYFPREALLATLSLHTATSVRPRPHDGSPNLTQRQTEVLERLRFGRSNKHIARELNMQEATVKVHVRQIMRKLGAANRTQAALLAQSKAHSSEIGNALDDTPNEMTLNTPAPEMIRRESSKMNFGI